MCLSPILIDNPYCGVYIRDPVIASCRDTVSRKLAVPCGRCSVCIRLRQQYLVQRVQMESLDNDLFYGTLTYNQEALPIAIFDDITFAYPDYSDWQNMIKRIRRDEPELKFKYLLVSEYGTKKHRPHYHFILSFPRVGKPSLAELHSKADYLFKLFLSQWKRNTAPLVWSSKRSKWITDSRNPEWLPLLTYYRKKTLQGWKYNYDLHYLDPNSSPDGLDGVSFYVTKYILKYDKWIDKFKSKLFFTLPEEDFKLAWSMLRPRILMSKGFGSADSPKVQEHILRGINLALSDPKAFYPYYTSRVNGSTFPLSPYYQKLFITPAMQSIFVSRRPVDDEEEDPLKKFLQFEDILRFLNSRIMDFDYDDIDNINIDNIDESFLNKKVPGLKIDDFYGESQSDFSGN